MPSSPAERAQLLHESSTQDGYFEQQRALFMLRDCGGGSIFLQSSTPGNEAVQSDRSQGHTHASLSSSPAVPPPPLRPRSALGRGGSGDAFAPSAIAPLDAPRASAASVAMAPPTACQLSASSSAPVLPAATPSSSSQPASRLVLAAAMHDHRDHAIHQQVGDRQGGAGESGSRSPRDVHLHIYHCDAITGFLNKAVLLHAEIPIYHVGVEVYGREWAFQYFENAWSDPCISGVQSCSPTRAAGYEYVKSVNLGPTPHTEGEAVGIINQFRRSWPACSYHITRRNCVTFAETFTRQLEPPTPFPSWLTAILEASSNSAATDAIVDYSWNFSKWWMIRSQQQQEGNSETGPDRRAIPAGANSASCSNLFSLLSTSGCTSLVKASG
mmetsp:Transcript_56872/g.144200  ORF Transcript_56872/g.144200 Transcript_56872/m.144200 type:complete len:384 (+) Transcript_56872:68-1219(+)